jgi:hypothetical protein
MLGSFLGEHPEIVLNKIIRTRLNVTFPSQDRRPNVGHVDLAGAFKHYVFLYFLNDSDADTILYSQKFDGTEPTQEDLTELVRFTPKAGTAVLFNGDLIHSWEHPHEYDYRCSFIINVDVDFIDI